MAACFCLLPSLSAQEIRKYEIGVDASYGFKVDKFKANNYGFDLFGGYRFNDHFSAGAGLSYINFNGRMDLPSGIEDVGIWTDNYSAYRPFVYGRYDFLPNRKWTPFVGVRLGYAFFRNTSLHYTVLATGTAYDPIEVSPVISEQRAGKSPSAYFWIFNPSSLRITRTSRNESIRRLAPKLV